MLSLRFLLAAVLLCMAAGVTFEVGSAVLAEHWRLVPSVAERATFLEEAPSLLEKWPFLAKVVEESQNITAVGDWLPAFDHAWASSSVVLTLRRVGLWMANNFVARMLSPETAGEKLMLLAFLIIVVYAGAAVYMHRQKMALFERSYMDVGRGRKAAPQGASFLENLSEALQ